MIEEGLPRPWPAAVRTAAVPFLQGHLIEKPPLFYAADLRHPVWQTTHLVANDAPEHERHEDLVDVLAEQRPPYGIITTQSCDLAEERPDPRQPWVAVAPVYQVAADSALLRREDMYKVAPAGAKGDDPWVADLRIEMPLEKGLLVDRAPIGAFPDEYGYIKFARFLAHRRGRPALASVFHDVLTGVTRRLKNENNDQLRLARAARANVYKLKLAVEEGTYLKPVAAKLYVITNDKPNDKPCADTLKWFDLWWNTARPVAARHGLTLLPTGWMTSGSVDARLYDELIEMRSPL